MQSIIENYLATLPPVEKQILTKMFINTTNEHWPSAQLFFRGEKLQYASSVLRFLASADNAEFAQTFVYGTKILAEIHDCNITHALSKAAHFAFRPH